MFNRKYTKVLKEIEAEIVIYEVERESYEKIRDEIKNADPENSSRLANVDYYINRYADRIYALKHLRDVLRNTIG